MTISLPKSLVSDVGGAEFAKKFRCKNLTVDLFREKKCAKE